MGKYDSLREAVSGGSSDATPSTGSKYDNLRMSMGLIPDTRPKTKSDTSALDRPVRPTRIETTSQPHVNGPVEMDEASPEMDIETKARQIPVLGHALRGLDYAAKKLEPVSEVLRSFYVPGASLSNIGALTGIAERGVAKALPSLGNSALGRIGQKAASEAIVGAPLGIAQTQMVNPDADGKELAEGAAWGIGGGAVLGGLGKGAIEALRYGRNTAAELGGNVINKVMNEQTLELPQGRGEARYNAAVNRSNLLPNEDPIATPYTFKLPEASDATITHKNNMDDAFHAVREIDDHLKSLDSQYQQAINDQYQYLKRSSKENRGGEKGNFIKDQATGEVVDRYGTISSKPIWYQKALKDLNVNNLNNKQLYELAKKHVDDGFHDDGGFVPSWIKENDYHGTKQSLGSVREEIRNSIKEKGLNITDSQLKEQLLKAKTKPQKLRTAPLKETVNTGTQDYAGNAIPFRQAAAQTDRTINRNQVVNNMRKNLNVTIDTGRLVSPKRGTLGQFKVKPEVIRTRMAEDLQVISHEVGHNLDKRYKLQDPAYQQELVNLTNTVNPNHLGNYQPTQQYEEAIAEYFRTRLTDPRQAEQLAPNFTKFLESKLSPKDLKGLEASAKDIDTWITQGDYNQAKGLIDFTGGSNQKKFSKHVAYSKFVDDLNYLKLAEEALKSKVVNGKMVKGSLGLGNDSIYKMARLSRGMEEKAKLAVTRGIYDAQGNKLSKGLTEIVKPLEEMGIKEKDFSTYLSVIHAQDLKAMGKQVPFTDNQMSAVLNRLDSPELRAIHKEIIGFNNALMDILVDAQVLDAVSVTAMRKKYPNYVPFMRYFDDDAVAGFKNGGFGGAKGFANISNPVKRMSEEGSLRTIINPVESMVKNTFLVMNAAAKNKVGLQLLELSKIDGAGAWVEHVGPGGASPTEHIVNVFQNGERQSLKIREPELYNAMLSLDTESSNSLLRFLGGTASLLRAGATLTPEFMVRNAFRDVVGATINSTKYGFNPIDFFKGLFHVVGKTKTFDQFLSSGGAMGTVASLDRDVTREALTGVFRKSLKDKTLNVVTSKKELAKMLTGITPVQKTIGVLRKGAEISELSTKVGLFNKTLKKTGNIEEAAFTARDIMDFNRAGSAIRPANKAVAFLNASIQGTDRMARAIKDNPAGFLIRAFTTLVLPSIGLYYYNNNLSPDMKEKYDNIPQWQKDSFFIMGIPGMNDFARIPKPFEAGTIFSTGTERVMGWLQENDPEAFKDYGATLLQSFTPPMLITAFTPLLEALTNHSLFRNAPIVPMGDQRFEKKDQYGIYTSETAKGLGKLISKTPLKDSNMASPRIIDNTIKGYTAGLGQYAISGIDSAINKFGGNDDGSKPAKSITEQPFVRSFFATTSGGGQVRQDFYDKWDKLSKAKASADRNEVPFADLDYPRMKSADDAMGKLMKQYKLIQTNKTMSGTEKRELLDKLDDQMNQVASMGLNRK